MKLLAFSRRTAREILRDPLNLAFGLGFPLVVLLLLTLIQANIPVSLFEIESLAPGIAVFGLSFMTLFSASLLARDRETAFLQRLYTTPMTPADFFLGYMLPLLPIALGQSALCYLAAVLLAAVLLGLPVTINILYALLFILPASLFFIAMGLLCGSILSVKQAGGVCGALFTNLTAWLSGIWFDLSLIGGALEDIANLLPFAHAVELERAVLGAQYSQLAVHLLWVLGYALLAGAGAAALFLRQAKRQ